MMKPTSKKIILQSTYKWSIWPAVDGHWRVKDECVPNAKVEEFNTPDEALAWIRGRITEESLVVPRLRSFFEYQRIQDPNFQVK